MTSWWAATATREPAPKAASFCIARRNLLHPRRTPRPITQAATRAGSTSNFVVQFDSNAPNGAALAAAALANCERDFTTLKGWFGNINVSNLPFHVSIQAGSNGASHKGCGSTDITCDAFNGTDTTLMSALLAAEVTEVFESNQGRGWDCGSSNGEALSRILSAEIYPNELNTPQANFATAAAWLNSSNPARPNWVDQTEGSDGKFVSIGCGTLFLNWLHYQLGFSWKQIVQAGGGTLAQTLQRLTGWTDGFTQFSALLNLKSPPGVTAGLANDNPFPIGPGLDGTLLCWQNGPVWIVYAKAKFELPDVATRDRLYPGARVHQIAPALLDAIDNVPLDGTILSEENGNASIIFGRAKFQFPDATTRNRLFPGVPVHPLWTGALVLISIIPIDGLFFSEESSALTYLIQGGRKRIATSSGAPVRILRKGALAQIPSWPSVITGRVTDTNGVPLVSATVLIVAPFPIPSVGSNSVPLTTDSTGTYTSPALPPATYQVSAVASGFVPSDIFNVPVLDGQPTATQDIRLLQALNFAVTGRVTDTAHMPISGATVTLIQNSAIPGILKTQTDANGHYTITMNPGSYNGNYGISAVADGYNRVDDVIASIPNGKTVNHDFTLVRVTPGNISGKVTDLSTGTPIVGASVYVGPLGSPTVITNTTDGGIYVAQNVLSGFTYVTVAAAGYHPVTQSITVVGGQTVALDFQLSPATPPSHPGPGPGPGPRPQ